MDNPSTSPAAEAPRLVGRFVAIQALIWVFAALMLAAAVARVAAWLQNLWAPLLIFPLLVGCGLGLLLVVVVRLARIGHRATISSGAILAVVVTVIGQHYLSFLDFKAALIAAKPHGLPLAEFQGMMPDASTSFIRFMRRQALEGRPVNADYTLRGAAAWASWAVDALLTLGATLTII